MALDGVVEQGLIRSPHESHQKGPVITKSSPSQPHADLVTSLAPLSSAQAMQRLANAETKSPTDKKVSLRVLETQLPPGVAYQELITNESVTGIVERGKWATENIHPTDFWGIGHPTKVALQAALLQPPNGIGLIDVSSQNSFDGVMLFSALQAGYGTIQSFLETPAGQAVYQNLLTTFPKSVEGQEFDTSLEHLTGHNMRSVDGALKYLTTTTGISLSEIIQAFQQTKDISVIWGSAKNVDAVTQITAGERVVFDSSHVPLGLDIVTPGSGPSVRSELSKANMYVAYALHSTDQTLKNLGVGSDGRFTIADSQGLPGVNTVWSHPPNIPGGGIMPVGIASGARYVNQIAPIADNKHGLY